MPCSPGMRNCVATCGHRRFVREYQSERARQESVADAETLGYATELAAYVAERPLVTFRQWLIDHAGPSPADVTVNDDDDSWEPPPGFRTGDIYEAQNDLDTARDDAA